MALCISECAERQTHATELLRDSRLGLVAYCIGPYPGIILQFLVYDSVV